MSSLRSVGLAVLLGGALMACSRRVDPPAPAGGDQKPTLLVFFTVDQLTPKYFDWFGRELDGGLARLLTKGAVFTDGHQDHAITETAPGHASTMSGRFPRSTGITRNLRGVNDRNSPLIGARDLGASPTRFRGTTVTDWLIAADPATRSLSVSAKDRGAILPIGRSRQNVFWFSNDGLLTTSTWYRDTLPDWVKAFNARRPLESYAGKSWSLLFDRGHYHEVDSVPVEAFGKAVTFPHVLPTDSARVGAQLRFTPFMDQMILAAALDGLRTLDIGRGPGTDVLAISLSSTDYVGHYYGPESLEAHDQIHRLDLAMGAFIDSLFTLRDSTRIIFALTADHGVGMTPERAGKLRVGLKPAMESARALVTSRGGNPAALELESGAFFIDLDQLKLDGESVDSIVGTFVTAARRIPGVARVDRFESFAKMDTTEDEVARRWLHMFPDDILPLAAATLAEGNVFDYPIIATHGSPNRHDSHVPIIFYGPPFKPGRYSAFVRTVDIAPTLAQVLGVEPLERLDGRPLTNAIRR